MTSEVILLIILTMCSAFFSCAEVAFFSIPSSQLKKFKTSQSLQKNRLAELLYDSRTLLVTIFMLNTIANVLVQNVSSDLFDSQTGGWTLKVVLPFLLLLVFGEFIPKNLGLIWSSSVSNFSTYIFWYLEKILSPFRKIILTLADFISYPFMSFLKGTPKPAQEEIEELLETCGNQGVLTKREADLLTSFMEIDQKQIKEIMIPRLALKTISKKTYIQSEKITPSHDPLIVFETELDIPVGYLSADDQLISTHLTSHLREKLINPILFIPEMMSIGALCFKMVQEGQEMACVVDEYGLTSGYVLKEDLIHQLLTTQVAIAQHPLIIKKEQDLLIVKGMIPLEIINDYFTIELQSLYHQITLNGWICEQLGRIPQRGEKITSQGVEIRVIEATSKAVEKAEVRFIKAPSKQQIE